MGTIYGTMTIIMIAHEILSSCVPYAFSWNGIKSISRHYSKIQISVTFIKGFLAKYSGKSNLI